MNLNELLHAHDPGRDASLRENEKRRIRAAILDASPKRSRMRRPLLAFAVVLIVILVVPFALRRTPEPPAAVAPKQPTQLQVQTPGGTRVVWVFNDEFSL